jgi:hypothetical protein
MQQAGEPRGLHTISLGERADTMDTALEHLSVFGTNSGYLPQSGIDINMVHIEDLTQIFLYMQRQHILSHTKAS